MNSTDSRSRSTVIYCYPEQSTFIRKDLDIISACYDLLACSVAGPKYKLPFRLLMQLLFLARHVIKSNVIVCRFAGYHTVLPVVFGKLFRRPVIIILGGTECHRFPAIGYGAQLKKLYRSMVNFSLRNASMLAPVHESLILSDYSYDESGMPRQGCYEFCKGLKTPFVPIYNGFDNSRFRNLGKERTKNSFVTVSGSFHGPNFECKGIDLLLEAAKKLPECRFTIIGRWPAEKSPVPENVTLMPPVPNEELNEIYNRHEFYLQLSVAEGFPNALCESMLAGCVPIGAATFGIPTIIDKTGFLLEKKSVNGVVDLIRNAMAADIKGLSIAAARRISNEFPLERRKKELTGLIDRMIRKDF